MRPDPERTLPHNIEAEKAVLGAVLIDNDMLHPAMAVLAPATFFRDAHRRIFTVMIALTERHDPIDNVTLMTALEKTGELEEVGGPAYIASLSDGVPRSTNVEYYAQIVRDTHGLRALIFLGNRLIADAYEGDRSAVSLVLDHEQRLADMGDNYKVGRMSTLRSSTSWLVKEIEHRVEHKGELRGLDTGFASINEVTGGWRPGDYIVLAARPSIGKTTFALNTMIAACRMASGRRPRAAFFSLEMTREQIDFKLLSHFSAIPLIRLDGGHLGQLDYKHVTAGLEAILEIGDAIDIDDSTGLNAREIRSMCRRRKSESGLDLIVIDYVQLMPGTLDRRGATRNDEITDISRRLKALARELKVPLILLSQLNRGAKDRADPRPRMQDLRESGALEQDADIVAFIHRKDHKASGVNEFIIEKQRNGPTGTVYITLDRDTATFTDGGTPEPEPAAPARGRARKRGKPGATLPYSDRESRDDD